MKTFLTMTTLAALLTGGPASFGAENAGGWKFEITPYAWLAGLEGDATVNGTKTDFEKSARDLFDAVEVGPSLRLSAAHDRFVVLGLLDTFSRSTDELAVEGLPAGGALDTDVDLMELAAGYTVDGWAEGQTFTLAIGARKTTIEAGLTPAGGTTTRHKADLTDPMFYVLPSMLILPSRIDGLRFNPVMGVGSGDSELVYELFPQIQYQLCDYAAARFGYRTVGYKFEGDGDGNKLNINLAGLVIGLGLTF